MENRKILTIVVLAAITRLLPHPPNIAPITAIALFSGAKINKKIAYLLPLSAMIISDFFLGFHSTMFYVYLSFLLITLVGRIVANKNKVSFLFSITLFSSLLFYLITNFGVWASTTIYAKSFNGLINCYLMGLPFLRNTLIGDLFYTSLFFYGYDFSSVLLIRVKNLLLYQNNKH